VPEIRDRINSLSSQLRQALSALQLEDKEDNLRILREQMSAPDFWRDPDKAKDLGERSKYLEKQIDRWRRLEKDILALVSLSGPESDQALAEHLAADLEQLEKSPWN